MREFVIDCAQAGSMVRVHDILAQELAFPHWYGRNLDALHDMLTGLKDPVHIRLRRVSSCGFSTGGLLQVLRDSREENPKLTVSIEA